VTCPEASTKTLLAAALALFAAGCGDGMDVQLGTKREFSPLPEGGTGDAGTGDGSHDADGAPPDSSTGCPNGTDIPAPLLALLDDRAGFGAKATGGKSGCLYRVTDFGDTAPGEAPRPGTLRFGLESPDALWIIFEGTGGLINLTDNIRPLSNKTIDGRETRVIVRNYGLDIVGQQNFVVANLEFVGDPDAESIGDSGDAITLRQGTHTVWIDHSTFSTYKDGLIDVIGGATDVTISWSHFKDQDMVMLLGSEDDMAVGGNMRVTLHHNWFYDTYTYNPRARWGMVHTFNNLVESWGDYGSGAGQDARLYSEANVYLADLTNGSNEALITQVGDEPPGKAWSEKDLFRGEAAPFVNGASPLDVFLPSDHYVYGPSVADDTLLNEVRDRAGVR
jgi:pectate lyase